MYFMVRLCHVRTVISGDRLGWDLSARRICAGQRANESVLARRGATLANRLGLV
jgi:hypothetical protein